MEKLEEQAKEKSVDELVRGAYFLPKILGPAYRAELKNRLGFDLSDQDIQNMKLAQAQFDEDHR